jgi:hypothetical protein
MASGGEQAPRHERCESLTEADLLVQLVDIVHAELDHCSVECVRGDFFERQAEFAERLIDQARAELDGLLPSQAFQIVTHGCARLGRHYEIDPRRIRHRALRRDDFHRLPVA